MKKIVTILAFAIAMSSCSNDDDNNPEEFFNLKVGNQWVYKRYTGNETQETYTGKTDTVKVVGTEIVEGKEYFRITHTDDFLDEESLRVDESGHLISSRGYVQHPGTDNEYTESRTILDGVGVMYYTLKDAVSVTVEDKNYEVHPFSGYYTPNAGPGGNEGEGAIDAYANGIGFVIKRYWYISRTSFLEWKLVSYDLK